MEGRENELGVVHIRETKIWKGFVEKPCVRISSSPVEEYNELMVRHGDPRARMLEVSRDGRKHSLPQLLDSTGTSQVAQHCGAPDFLIQSQLLGSGQKSVFRTLGLQVFCYSLRGQQELHVLKTCLCMRARSI